MTFWNAPGSGADLTHRAALAQMAAGRVVLLGERHDRAEDHRWQAEVISGLAALRDGVVVGCEMFPKRCQPVLDAWVSSGCSMQWFLENVRWSEVWGFDADLYLPILETCRDLRLPMLALNLDRPIVTLVGREGWPALPEAERRWMTPARPASAAYRRYLFEMTGGARPGRAAVGPEDPAFDRFARAQQVWDRAFACSIAACLAARPEALVVGLIGRGHLEFGHGTPDQLDELGIGGVSVALPGADIAPDRPPIADLAFSMAEPMAGAGPGNC